MKNKIFTKLKELTIAFSKEVNYLSFSLPVVVVYNPLEYARESYFKYLELTTKTQKKTVYLGMNPGPWGMAQTGIPFGEISAVRDWMKIKADIGKPSEEHPKRMITGFNCSRSEVSGRRLWGYFKEKFKTPEVFFKNNFVANYCPLVFMEDSGRNRTPDKLSKGERDKLYKICDKYLLDTITVLNPERVIGIGGFAEQRIASSLANLEIKTGKILHPSPASPMANRGWAEIADSQLEKIFSSQ